MSELAPINTGARTERTRLFVPLAKDPFDWFQSGKKEWEIRFWGRQYTDRHVYIGRRVELRRGYSDPDASIWGFIADVKVAESLCELFNEVDFARAIPSAKSEFEAITICANILRVDVKHLTKVIAFRIKVDSSMPELRIHESFIDKILAGSKRTTIRRGERNIQLGPALFTARSTSIPIVVQDVETKRLSELTDADATADGFTNLVELKSALRHFYSSISPSDVVSIIRFRVAKNPQYSRNNERRQIAE